MPNDELVNATAPLIKKAHDLIDASDLSPRVKRKMAVAHALLEEVLEHVKGEGLVSANSGPLPKDEPPQG